MKKHLYKTLIASAGLLATMAACDSDLDSDKYFEDRPTLESVFSSVDQTNQWLSRGYYYLTDYLVDCATNENGGKRFWVYADDVYFGDRDGDITGTAAGGDSWGNFHQGLYDENYGAGYWEQAYKGIFQASVFIHNVDRNTQLTEAERLDMKGQARFLRAYCYWMLLRHYGPVPILPDEGADYTKDYEELSYPRRPYEEVAQFIASEMLQASNELQTWSRFWGNSAATDVCRPTKGAALAVRALAYVFAASPLANGQLANGEHEGVVTDAFAKNFRNRDGEALLGLNYDESKWARAAAALRDVIECPANYELFHMGVQTIDNKTAGYPKTITPFKDGDFSEKNWPDGYADIDPYLSYRDLFNSVAEVNCAEVIFTRGYVAGSNDMGYRHGTVDGFVPHQLPATMNGFNSHGMTQKMVDAYYMKDGSNAPGANSEWGRGDGTARPTGFTTNARGKYPYTKYPPLGQDVSMQYANREPRFYASVGFNGSYWWNQSQNVSNHYQQIFYYRGGGNGYTNNCYHLRNGIGMKKWIHPEDFRDVRSGSDYADIKHHWEPAIRYADILLLYAECINELNGSYTYSNYNNTETYTLSRDINEIKRGIRPVRIRGGVPDFKPEVYASQSECRKSIKRERMIELVSEGKRYYDLRRWMDAPVEENIPVYGCNVLMTAKQRDAFQEVVPCYALPTTFTDKMYFWPISFSELKRNRNLVQAPGWKLQD